MPVLPSGLDPATVRVVFLDLDGTILHESRPIPSAGPAIARLRATGVQVVIATGRMFTSARRMARELDLDGLIVCYQGAVIGSIDDGVVLRHDPLETGVAVRILAAVGERRHQALAMVDEAVYVARDGEIPRRYARSSGVPYEVVGDLASWLDRPPTKLVVMGETWEMDELRDELQASHGHEAFIAKSLPHYLEIAAPGIDKGHGAAVVCDLLGVARTETVAFGDGENDMELIEFAGTGAALRGGFGPLIERADWVVPSLLDDGVPRALDLISAARTGRQRSEG